MATLDRHPDGVAMGELSSSLLVSNGNVTALVRQLESDGYASTWPDPADRRSTIASLTKKGRRHFSDLASAHRTWIKRMFAGMSHEDQVALYRLLALLKTSLAADQEPET
jgi:DNA-binding MarR family transcriptional regulator